MWINPLKIWYVCVVVLSSCWIRTASNAAFVVVENICSRNVCVIVWKKKNITNRQSPNNPTILGAVIPRHLRKCTGNGCACLSTFGDLLTTASAGLGKVGFHFGQHTHITCMGLVSCCLYESLLGEPCSTLERNLFRKSQSLPLSTTHIYYAPSWLGISTAYRYSIGYTYGIFFARPARVVGRP